MFLATNTPHKINTPLMQLVFNFVQYYVVFRVFNDQILMEPNGNIDTELNKVESQKIELNEIKISGLN